MAGISGVGMLLKSMGVDPEEIQKAANQFPALLSGINARFQNIESKMDRILEILEGEVIDAPDDGISIRALTDGKAN